MIRSLLRPWIRTKPERSTSGGTERERIRERQSERNWKKERMWERQKSERITEEGEPNSEFIQQYLFHQHSLHRRWWRTHQPWIPPWFSLHSSNIHQIDCPTLFQYRLCRSSGAETIAIQHKMVFFCANWWTSEWTEWSCAWVPCMGGPTDPGTRPSSSYRFEQITCAKITDCTSEGNRTCMLLTKKRVKERTFRHSISFKDSLASLLLKFLPGCQWQRSASTYKKTNAFGYLPRKLGGLQQATEMLQFLCEPASQETYYTARRASVLMHKTECLCLKTGGQTSSQSILFTFPVAEMHTRPEPCFINNFILRTARLRRENIG